MIFVTVGTHEQPFNRLVECIDKLVENDVIKEDIVIQIGYSTYEPKYCKWSKFFPYNEMVKNVAEARIVITHGGPSSFIMPLQVGKIPIVVPRRKEFNEHVNDHQVNFCKAVAEKMGTILVINDMDKLSDMIQNYNNIVSDMRYGIDSNNAKFCAEFEKIVNEII